MPKQIDYPRATLKNSLELAQAVDGLGGRASPEMVADAMSRKVSGAFHALVSSAAKYGLVVNKKGQIEITELFRNYKLAYTAEEAASTLTDAYLNVPLFQEVFSRFEGNKLPVDHLEKLLVREFGVPDQMGSRVAKYFLEGAQQCELLGPDYVLSRGNDSPTNTDEKSDEYGEVSGFGDNNPREQQSRAQTDGSRTATASGPRPSTSKDYSVRITGPGMDSVISVQDEEDLTIVRAMLTKVERKLTKAMEEDDEKEDQE